MTDSPAWQKAHAYIESMKLPKGSSCKDCVNYRSWCRDVYAGEKPLDENSTTCAAGRADEHFQVDFRKPSAFITELRRQR